MVKALFIVKCQKIVKKKKIAWPSFQIPIADFVRLRVTNPKIFSLMWLQTRTETAHVDIGEAGTPECYKQLLEIRLKPLKDDLLPID